MTRAEINSTIMLNMLTLQYTTAKIGIEYSNRSESDKKKAMKELESFKVNINALIEANERLSND